MSAELSELEQLLVIDEENLLIEWKQQPVAYIKVCRLAARAAAATSLLRQKLRETEAKLSIQFRAVGIPQVAKVTDEAIKAAVRADPDMIALEHELINLEEREQLLSSLVRAFEQRERSLKYCTQLQGMPLQEEDADLLRAARKNALANYR